MVRKKASYNNNENNEKSKVNKNEKLKKSLKKNKTHIEDSFFYPTNTSLIVKDIHVKAINKMAAIYYLDVICDVNIILKHILQPLSEDYDDIKSLSDIEKKLLNVKKTVYKTEVKGTINEILKGNTIIIIDGYQKAIVVNTTKVEARQVEEPLRENVIKGPMESFVESIKTNQSLIKKQLRDENLISEKIMVGKRSFNPVFLLYVKNLVNPDLVNDVRNRISRIDVDSIQGIEILEQLIEEKQKSIIPQLNK